MPGLLMATMMAGAILVVMGLAKMGSLIKYIPWPVTSGFTTGIAVAIIATQTGDFLGIHTEEPAPREFFERLHWLGHHIGDMHVPSVLLAVGCLLVILFWPRLGFRKVPAMDATALNALESVVERLQNHGGTVILSGLHRQPLDILRKAGFIKVIGRANLVAHFDDALVRAREILDAASDDAAGRG